MAHDLEVLKSPGWHRRLRAKRAKARLTIRQHRALHLASSPTPRVLAAIKFLEKHHSAPVYKETMYNKGWNKQMQWDAWSPQWPKGGPKPNKKNQEKPKDKQQSNVLSSYDSFAGGPLQSASSSGGQDSQLFKEFLSYMKENRAEMPENIQRLIPEDQKEGIREAQKKLNKHRNLLNKISNKQKALQLDQERWDAWLLSVREEIQQQKAKHEESQARLTKEIAELQEEEKKLGQPEEESMVVEEEEKGVEEMLDDMIDSHKDKLKMQAFQTQMEARYQQQLHEERQKMQQFFSDQFRQLATAATMLDPYMAAEGTGLLGGLTEGAINVEEDVENQEPKEATEANLDGGAPPGLVKNLVRNPIAPFGVQRTQKSGTGSVPYSPEQKKEVERKKEEKEKQRMRTPRKPNDTGQD